MARPNDASVRAGLKNLAGEDAPPDITNRAPARARFHFIDDESIERLPPPKYMVDDFATCSGLSALYAPPEHFKSFLLVDLAFCLGTGTPFHGRAVRQGNAIIVAAEGSAGLPIRVAAWKHAHEHFGPAGVHFVTEPVNLLDAGTVSTFLAAIDTLPKRPAFIAFDTFAMCMPGGDEGTRDIGVAIGHARQIQRATDAHVMLVHHTRLDGDRERGGTALRGACDTMLSLKREGDFVTVTCEKQKDAPHFQPFTLELVPTQDSCTLITPQTSERVTRLIPSDPAFKALRSLYDSSLEDGLTTSQWLKVSGMPDATFYKARKSLTLQGYIEPAAGRGKRNVVSATGRAAL